MQKVDPRVSVIMPVYNGEEFLEQAIESILEQTFKDFEFIIICEYGTNKASLDIISKYAEKDSRIVVFYNDSRQGIAASLNIGFRAAKGEFFARMDGDDISLPGRLANQVRFMDDNPDVAICGSGFVCIDERDRRLSIRDNFSEDPEQIKADLLFYCYIRHPTIMFRKNSVFMHNLFYDERLMTSEDYELWCRAVHTVKFAKAPGILLKYRWHKNNATHLYNREGVENFINIMRSNFARLSLTPTKEQLEYLCLMTCEETFSNHREIEKVLDGFYDTIIEKNRELKIYDEDCLIKTMESRLYWRRQKVRRFMVVSIRFISEFLGIKILSSFAKYWEYNGLVQTIKRVFYRGSRA